MTEKLLDSRKVTEKDREWAKKTIEFVELWNREVNEHGSTVIDRDGLIHCVAMERQKFTDDDLAEKLIDYRNMVQDGEDLLSNAPFFLEMAAKKLNGEFE